MKAKDIKNIPNEMTVETAFIHGQAYGISNAVQLMNSRAGGLGSALSGLLYETEIRNLADLFPGRKR